MLPSLMRHLLAGAHNTPRNTLHQIFFSSPTSNTYQYL
jgi:hypothetical protein